MIGPSRSVASAHYISLRLHSVAAGKANDLDSLRLECEEIKNLLPSNHSPERLLLGDAEQNAITLVN